MHTEDDYDYINYDEIIRKYGDWKDSSAVLSAGKEAARRVADNIAKGVSFCQETTLCGNSILRNIVEIKKNGYYIEMHYIGLESVEIAKKRVEYRVSHGGHGIPEKDIERRYAESFRNLKNVSALCDLLVLYDNSQQLRRVAVLENGTCVKKFGKLPQWFSILGVK